MDVESLVVAGWVVALVAVLTAVASSAQHRRASTRRLGRAVGLEVPEQLRPAIEARTARRNRLCATGIAVGMGGWVLLGQGGGATEGPPGAVPVILGVGIVGAAIGSAVAAATERITQPRDAVRIARARAVSVDDYLPPSELQGARTVVGVSVLLAVVALALVIVDVPGIDIPFPTAPLGMIASGAASLAVFEVVARRILDRGRPAGSPLELAWDDALRAAALREMITAPICLAIWGGIGLLLAVGDTAAGTLGTGADAAAAILTLVVLVGGLATAIGRRPRQHYLRRLWPDMAAGRGVQVG